MTDQDRLAMKRYYLIQAVNLAATASAVLGLVIAGRSNTTYYTLLGAALVLVSLYMLAVIPRLLAKRWKTPQP